MVHLARRRLAVTAVQVESSNWQPAPERQPLLTALTQPIPADVFVAHLASVVTLANFSAGASRDVQPLFKVMNLNQILNNQ